MRVLTYILIIIHLFGCGQNQRQSEKQGQQDSISTVQVNAVPDKQSSNKQLLPKSFLHELTDSLIAREYTLDVSHRMDKQLICDRIYAYSLVIEDTNIDMCECDDSISLFKFSKDGFEHNKRIEFYSRTTKNYETRVYIFKVDFKDKEAAVLCLQHNNSVFNTNGKFPAMESMIIGSSIIMVRSETQYETELSKEVYAVIQKLAKNDSIDSR